jgi:histidine triad (HIT) family protein
MCLFCKIVKGEIPADIVHRDDQVVAFRDISPQAPVHILVIPVKHIASLTEPEASNGEMLSKIFAVIQKIAADMKLDKGFRVVTNCGSDGGQTVDHIHFHVLGKRSLTWPPG